MATQHHPRKKHSASRKHKVRNAIGSMRPIAARPRARRHHRNAATTTAISAVPATHHVVIADVAKMGLAALGSGAACAYVEREDWLPPLAATGLVTAAGLGLAALGSVPQKMVGYGLIAGSVIEYLGAEILGTHDEPKTGGEPKPEPPSKPAAPLTTASKPATDTHRQSSFEGFPLPPGALEAAYQRARERLAMEQAEV